MAFTVPENQSVSWTVYFNTVSSQFPHSFVKKRMARIYRAFEMGESTDMITSELRMVYGIVGPERSKTPRQLASRVVRVA